MAIIECMNNKCKYYCENGCTLNLKGIRIILDENGQCKTFEKGKNDWYIENKVETGKEDSNKLTKEEMIEFGKDIFYDDEEYIEYLYEGKE